MTISGSARTCRNLFGVLFFGRKSTLTVSIRFCNTHKLRSRISSEYSSSLFSPQHGRIVLRSAGTIKGPDKRFCHFLKGVKAKIPWQESRRVHRPTAHPSQPPNQKNYNFYYSLIITTTIIKTPLFIVFSTYRRLRIHLNVVLLLELSVNSNFSL
jgi:hypothetical protein